VTETPGFPRGDFPYDGNVSLRFVMQTPQEFTLRVRIPGYAASDVPLALNGRRLALGKPGSYAVVYRRWLPGDTVTFEIPMGFAAHPYAWDCEVEGYDRCAYTYGPLLMAVVGEPGLAVLPYFEIREEGSTCFPMFRK